MRITHESLQKIVRDTVNRRTRADRGLVTVYLHGSMLGDEFLLGGATDIDLFFIHTDDFPLEREIVALSAEVHLDIAHHYYRDYRNTRALRIHPWQGPTIKDCKILYDPQHFMDFTQASVRGQYERPEFILQRSRKQFESARQIWLSLETLSQFPEPKDLLLYLRALENSIQSVIGLFGPPLTERRFLQNLPARLDEAGRPGLYLGLLGLLGAAQVEPEMIKSWLPLWRSAYQSLSTGSIPTRLHPARYLYYANAFDALLVGSQPKAVLWPLLRSWTLMADLLADDDHRRKDWETSLAQLQLSGEGFSERVDALDAFLDSIEETLDNWASANGVSPY